MSEPPREAPTNLQSLQTRIRNRADARGQPVGRLQRAVANTVVGQMLVDGVVKGGTAMKIRVGEARSRFSPDFDALRPKNVRLDDYIDHLRARLDDGWGGFTGTVEELEPARPEGVPAHYVMQPFRIRLEYQGRHWLSVEFELGHDEIGSAEEPDRRIADDILEIFAVLGLETPAPIPVMSTVHQFAQKLHACTAADAKTSGNERAYDLVDLQILDKEETIDLAGLRTSAAGFSRLAECMNGRRPSSSMTAGTPSTRPKLKASPSSRTSRERSPGRTRSSHAASAPASEHMDTRAEHTPPAVPLWARHTSYAATLLGVVAKPS